MAAPNMYSIDVNPGDSFKPIIPQASGYYRENLVRLSNLLMKLAEGGQTASYSVTMRSSKTPATGTVTFAAAAAADTVTINGVVFTAVASGPVGNQWVVGVSNTADAAALAAAVNASVTANVKDMVSAAAVAAVVTLSANPSGLPGNFYTLASSNGARLAVSGALLTGGLESSITYAL